MSIIIPEGTVILHGDALSLIPQYPLGTFDGVISDPPYASGGVGAERQRSTATNVSSRASRSTT